MTLDENISSWDQDYVRQLMTTGVHPDEKNEPDVIVSVDDCLFELWREAFPSLAVMQDRQI